MFKYIFLSLLFYSSSIISAQKSFVGALEYNISKVDLISNDTLSGKLFIYALDSLVRFNYLLADGTRQESIHHIKKRKFLTLLQIDDHFFAVQIIDSSLLQDESRFYKTLRRKKIAGLRCNGGKTKHSGREESFYYFKKIPNHYFVGQVNAPGLPTLGRLATENGWMNFELQQIDFRPPPLALFVPDKKYTILSLNDFLQWAKTYNDNTPKTN